MTVKTTTKATTKTTAARKATKAPAKKVTTTRATTRKAATTKAAVAKVARTFTVGSLTKFTCRTCGESKPVRSFGTTKGPEVRSTECRACRDADKTAAAAAAKKAPAKK